MIARVRLKSVENRSFIFCRFYSGWAPVIQYKFEVLETLKGSHQDTLLVNTSFGGVGRYPFYDWKIFESSSQANESALYRIHELKDRWDWRREAIVFVAENSTWESEDCAGAGFDFGSTYAFTTSGGQLSPKFRIESEYNRTWLLAEVEGRTDANSSFYLESPNMVDDMNSAEAITALEIVEIIRELERAISNATFNGITKYEDCLKRSLFDKRWYDEIVVLGGNKNRHYFYPERSVFVAAESGVDENTPLSHLWGVDRHYDLKYEDYDAAIWLSGPASMMFSVVWESNMQVGIQHAR